MDNKKIRKSASLSGIIMSMLLCIGLVLGGYLYFSENMTQAGKTVDTKYTDFYDRMDSQQDVINTNTTYIQDKMTLMKESDNPLIAAWNGLKGLGSTLLLFVSVPGWGWDMATQSFNMLDQIPTWIKTLALITVLTFIVIIVLKVIKGEPGGIDS